MKKKRLIPILLLKNGFLVQSKNFDFHQNLGHPIQAAKRLSEWCSDELIYLDITRDENYDTHREDHKYKNYNDFLSIIKEVSKVTFMPITIGGKIKNIKDIEKRFESGADKVCLNSEPLKNPKIINQIAKEFGSQCLIISIDVKKEDNEYVIYYNCGKIKSQFKLIDWIKMVQDDGAGEILINSIDCDGNKKGYDLELLKIIDKHSKIPVIACGGAGKWEDFEKVFNETNIDAVAAANIFHHSDQSVYMAKKFLYEKNLNVRKPNIFNIKNEIL